MAQRTPNKLLTSILGELGWSPRRLATQINRVHGAGVSPGAPYHWRSGRVPDEPVRSMAVEVLSEALGRPLSSEELWGVKVRGTGPRPSIEGPELTRAGTDALLDDWIGAGLMDRRRFVAVSGATLTAVADQITTTSANMPTNRSNASSPVALRGGPLVEQVEALVPMLQRLDDAQGAGAFEFVSRQFRTVAVSARHESLGPESRTRLIRALAEIAQLAGWMALDAGRHGVSQRYLLSAVRLAHDVGYTPLVAHALADLAFGAAVRGHGADAVDLGSRAAELTTNGPVKVRASVVSRLAYAHAVHGDLAASEQALATAFDLIHRANPSTDAHDPAWMYYLTPGHITAQGGYAHIHAGLLAHQADQRDKARSLLRTGQHQLRTGAHELPFNDPTQQRRALVEGSWLAAAAAARGNIPEAAALGSTAVRRAAHGVQSARAVTLLDELARQLRRKRDEDARSYLSLYDDWRSA